MLVCDFNYLMYTMPKSKEKTSKGTQKKKRIRATPGAGNHWAYRETLDTIKETDALLIEDILQLNCRDKYKYDPIVLLWMKILPRMRCLGCLEK